MICSSFFSFSRAAKECIPLKYGFLPAKNGNLKSDSPATSKPNLPPDYQEPQ
uniref:Uncharacterized protein n=1 Tax=Candidatus Kentrum sp. MB TaxID=2138164 RepID=A0A450Y1N5_9GAMM|nr:MAG: hypothetical protein BECKMB1821G_GA0114241_101833 [Candidatus Kentron sp. MB]VFK35457.1 MAG: hypothetical protein BECKMB1821I_GA0114274_11197 [Candidatus Kentron sp. MB]VFK77400.1 MAG: hypothetical protein BECKMB1821H_GA0114242_11337 [Candidatus Kentron sp. MB]